MTDEVERVVMRIKIKKNNQPKRAGFYLCRRNKDSRVQVAEIHKNGDLLVMIHGISVFPLNRCEKDALWSDEIAFA